MELFPSAKKPAELQVGGVPRVNLLPRQVIAKRAQTKLFTSWGIRIFAAALVVAVACVGLFAWKTVSAAQLAAAQSEGDTLITQIAAESDTQLILTEEQELTSFLREAMGPDVVWVPVFEGVRSTFPDGAWIGAFSLQSGGAPASEPTEQVGLTGTISVMGAFSSAVPFLENFRQVAGLTEVTVIDGEWDAEAKAYVHNLKVTFDQTVYSGDDAEEAQ